MPTLITQPTRIQSAGNKPKLIDEYIGRVNSKTSAASVAHMRSPAGWLEPGQTPAFDEFTIVLKGTLHVEHKNGSMEVTAGQAVIAHAGEWVRYSTPQEGGAEYIAVCLPAFSMDTVHRDPASNSIGSKIPMPTRTTVVFDLGGVLIDWNPRHLYRKLFAGDDAAMEHFLANICTTEWNLQQDGGRPFAEACAELKSEHPDHAGMIDAWFLRFDEMMAGPIAETVEIMAELRNRGTPLYALSNWSAETFPFAQKRFHFLQWFQGILLSAEVRLTKPDPRIFQHFLQVFALDPAQAVYIDDLPRNVEAAGALGMHAILFTNSVELRRELVQVGLLHPVGQIDHAAAWVSDLEQARAFYERWFKATAAPVYASSTRNLKSCFLSLGSGARLELMTSPGEPIRLAHLAISVGSREAVDQLVKAMEAAGVRIVSAPRLTGDGCYEAVIADPEGNLLEITV